ncbi:hypothetical protein ACFYZ5_44950 [Streptomyces chartreusis]
MNPTETSSAFLPEAHAAIEAPDRARAAVWPYFMELRRGLTVVVLRSDG